MRACPMDFLKKDILKLGLVAMGISARGISACNCRLSPLVTASHPMCSIASSQGRSLPPMYSNFGFESMATIASCFFVRIWRPNKSAPTIWFLFHTPNPCFDISDRRDFLFHHHREPQVALGGGPGRYRANSPASWSRCTLHPQ